MTKIAIVGRPNVGKSTLFNRLVGKRLALVDDQPGVTRDRREAPMRLGDRDIILVDTAGLDDRADASLSGRMGAQTLSAIREADLVLVVVDGRAGVTPADKSVAAAVRKSGKRVILAANKSEGRAGAAGALEAYGLGLGDPLPISAEHGEGIGDLLDAMMAGLPPQDEPAPDEAAAHAIRVAVVGRPNAGKSTLINRLLGEERLLTGPEAGITRDAIAVDLTWRGRPFRVFDTAGLRRRSRIDEKLEKLSVGDALQAIRFAEVVVLLLDADRRFEEQDLRIADLVVREGRALVVGVSKWDAAERKRNAAEKLREEVDHWLPQVRGVPIVPISALTGEGLDALMQAVLDSHAVWNRRVATNPLNRFLATALEANPPPAVSGRRLKFNYMTQPKARPPSFVLFCTRADAVPESYLRYLTNGLRETFDLPGTPIRITLREKANPYVRR